MSIREIIARVDPKPSIHRVWCLQCGSTRRVNVGECLKGGWPKCCGYTMTIDTPEDRAMIEAAEAGK